MRLTSDFFVSTLLRRAALEGAFAALRHRGQAQAGAIFLIVDYLDGTATLLGPAPQTSYDDHPSDRLFARLHKEERVEREVVEMRLEKELKFDPDAYVVEIEDRQGRAFVEIIPLP